MANLGAHGEIIRVMPNTPALVNAAASAYAVNPFTDESAKPLIPVVESIFNAIGLCCEVSTKSGFFCEIRWIFILIALC